MAKPDEYLSPYRGDYGDLLLNIDVYKNIRCVDNGENLIIQYITDAIEIIKKQQKYVGNERALECLSIKGQVLNSLENARNLMSVLQERSISKGPRSFPPTPDDMRHFLNKWREKRSNS